ncbi:MAG TPA: hypothetical protein PLO37_02605 [Candidatus Hydrogenedentes bacterium]|nr:hypothetical protein [Candidatus Hydrogenedentota bacterium]HPG65710.1 hypothetical protein [Candidatus Hydrogenedentota bacterium]
MAPLLSSGLSPGGRLSVQCEAVASEETEVIYMGKPHHQEDARRDVLV